MAARWQAAPLQNCSACSKHAWAESARPLSDFLASLSYRIWFVVPLHFKPGQAAGHNSVGVAANAAIERVPAMRLCHPTDGISQSVE